MHSLPLDKKLKHLTPDRMFWWISLIAAIATSVLAGAFFFYWLYFGGNEPSKNPSDWGPFGDFIGGVTNPIISFFALLSLLLTLVMQSKQLDATREQLQHAQETTSKQFSHMEREAKKADITRTLQVLEGRLERLYREPVYFVSDGNLEQWEVYLLLSHATPEVLRKVPALTDLGPPQYRNEYLRTKATLTQLHITLVKFSMQLTSLVNVDAENDMSWFYEPTLGHLARKLKEIGYLPSPDDQTIEHSQTFRNRLRESRRSAV
jgi:uncharacterized membrane protein